MDKYKEQLKKCIQVIDRVRDIINLQRIPSNAISYNELYGVLYQLIPLIPDEYHKFRDRLRDKILPNLKTSDILSINQYGQQLVTPQNGINPYSFGEAISTIAYLMDECPYNNQTMLWDNIHHQIVSVAKNRFDDGYYADSVESAFKEINSRVKKIYLDRTGIEKDGTKLMQAAFSVQNPIIKIGDISTDTGRDIQQGYMEMFSGSVKGIRNPKAHNNQTISKSDAIRKLHFASMLMYKIDNEI